MLDRAVQVLNKHKNTGVVLMSGLNVVRPGRQDPPSLLCGV